MRKPGLPRLILSLLLLWQFAGSPALASLPSTAHTTASSHCAGHLPAPADPVAPGHCCDQAASCHCPQAPALAGVEVRSGDADDAAAPRVRLRDPPPLLRTDEHFRPPI